MIWNVNPYPKQPGFSLRVARAQRALKQLAREPKDRSPVTGRGFYDCFENGDGAAVVWALMHSARTDPELQHGIVHFAAPSGHLLEEWRRAYGSALSLRDVFQLAAKPQVDRFAHLQ